MKKTKFGESRVADLGFVMSLDDHLTLALKLKLVWTDAAHGKACKRSRLPCRLLFCCLSYIRPLYPNLQVMTFYCLLGCDSCCMWCVGRRHTLHTAGWLPALLGRGPASAIRSDQSRNIRRQSRVILLLHLSC